MNSSLQLNQNIVVYEDGEIELKVSLEHKTIWLTQKQIAELFDKDVRTVNEHINTIYEEKELYKNSTIRNFRIVSLCPKLELGNEGKALGWSPKKKLAEYIEECRRNNWR